MKSKIVFLFLFISLAFTNSAYSDSYFGYKSFGNTWYDANKTLSNTLDDPFCTVAAASNVLKYTGWDAGFGNAGAIFAEFLDLWASSDIKNRLVVRNSWSLWLNGTYIVWTSPTTYEWRTDVPGRGNFYPANSFADYYHTEDIESNVLAAADNFLHNGYGVTLIIQVGGDIMQHTVTLWGYDYDAQGNYLGIWITDSDDYYPDPNNPKPKLSYYNIHYDQSSDKWWIDGYQIPHLPSWGSNFYIRWVAALDRNPVAFFDDFIYVSTGGPCNDNNPCFPNIQNGIALASAPSVIKITEETYNENIILGFDQVITLQGGWNTTFTSSSSYTTIQGSITITNGTMILENIILE